MQGRTVQLRVGGQTYRVVTSASEDELRRLAAVVDQKLAAVVPPGRAVTPQAMLLAAMALAHELEAAQANGAAFRAKARGAFGRLIERVDTALEETGAAPSAERPRALSDKPVSTMGETPKPPAQPLSSPPAHLAPARALTSLPAHPTPIPTARPDGASKLPLRQLEEAGPAGHPANES